jgi:bifunctional oligoribonuclease and PAP phosphatase NrnA
VGTDLDALAATVPAPIAERLAAARTVLAVGHENPDADALGALIAMARIVTARGGRATMASSDPPAALYRFMPGVAEIRADPDPALAYDLIVICDCCEAARTGSIAARHADLFAHTPTVVLDHHASAGAGSELSWVDEHAAATCELVALIALRLGVPLGLGDGELATVLMAGLVMDTATFAHPNTTPRTLRLAAALLEAGAPLADISRRLYRIKPEAQLRLFGRVLAQLQSHADGRVVTAILALDDLAAAGALPEHSEGLVDLLVQAEEAEVALLFKEQDDGTCRLSVRTKDGGVDATALVADWGGGGHRRAAGATIELPVAKARAVVLPAALDLAGGVRR